MNFFKKSCLVAISIILCFTVLCQTATAAFWGDKTLYVKDLKIIYADSEKEAKEQLPKGYNLLPDNINDGTGELGVYICYSTTDNPDEAITDIKVMHESGGFQRTDFKSSLDEAIDGVYDSDPKTNPNAKRYDEVSIQDVVDQKLAVMDLTASIMCMENKMPMYVFGLNEEDSIVKAMSGEFNGTKVTV